jgi:exosome complex exonuclease DIS3/RRP44
MGTYARLRALCHIDVDDAQEKAALEQDQAADRVPVKGRGAARSQRDMSTARNARRFYVFPNEFFRETYVDREASESVNDRNDRAIRRVAHWYKRQLVGPEILLLTDDRACRSKAVADGITALTANDYVQRMKKKYPEAGEKLAIREQEDDDSMVKPGDAAKGVKRKAGSLQAGGGGGGRAIYPAHLKASEVEAGLKDKSLVQGVLRMNINTCMYGSINSGIGEVEIAGRLSMNRAIDGDVVAIELLDDAEEAATESAEKKARTAVGASDLSSGAKTSSITDALREQQIGSAATDKGSRKKGRVVGIIKRNWREYCGTLRPLLANRKAQGVEGKAERVFIPADSRVPNVFVQTRNSSTLENKRIVIVIDGWDRYSHCPRGHWTQVLGEVGDRATESAVILHEHGVITREFSEAVLRCLPPGDFTPGEEDLRGREDLRHICTCSIDPPGCKDIDDAISCEPLPNGNFRLGVHIADVTHFVLPDTAVDREASERCTTVYLVEKRTDMLPSLLTTDLCSLVGGVERLAFTVLWEMTPQADQVSVKYCKSIIKSRAALSYAEAQARMDDTRDSSEITTSIRNANHLCKLLRKKRVAKGALELASQEVKFELDSETQDPTDVAEYQQRETNKLIEELMLLANQAVATKILSAFPMFGVLRRHPPPKDDALKSLRKLLLKLGFDFKFGSNKELGQSLDAATRPQDPFFNTLVRSMTTRCMNQAIYFCTGEVQPALYSHYGLAMELYTHFTSPIRRYADVLVHRLLMAAIGLVPLPESMQAKALISEQCDKINVKHRMAQWAGRASGDLHTFLYFNAKGAQTAEAVITRVRRTGTQVNVPRYGIDGVVALPEETWDINEDEQTVSGKGEFFGVKLDIFSRIVVKIEADNTDFRNRTRLEFVRVSKEGDAESYADAEKSRKVAQREMYPDRLVRESN